MNRSRHILAVVAVTTALCADQVVSAAPVVRTPVAEMAARLVARLSETFAHTIPNNVRPVVRFQRTSSEPQAVQFPVPSQVVLSYSLSPFQFRLPPPVL